MAVIIISTVTTVKFPVHKQWGWLTNKQTNKAAGEGEFITVF
jgi:hypothetical protein